MENRFQHRSSKIIGFIGVFFLFISACQNRSQTPEPITIYISDKQLVSYVNTKESLEVAYWRTWDYTCDQNDNVINVIFEVAVVGGIPPYEVVVGVSNNTPRSVIDSPSPVTETPTRSIDSPAVTAVPPLLPNDIMSTTNQLLVNLSPGVANISIYSADGQNKRLTVRIPYSCSELEITPIVPTNTPKGIFVSTGTSQPQFPISSPTPISSPPARYTCSDGVDNDGDGYIDLFDPECKNKADSDESQ